MTTYEMWASRRAEFGLLLQRKFWKPLRSTMDIFHMLPLAAVVILFVLLATDGQFREIYIAYLEGPADNPISWIAGIVAGFVALALISAVLYEAHYSLSTMRLNIIYSNSSNPEARSKLRGLQRAAAFVLAFLPWLGLTVGLFGARNFVANRYCQLLNVAGISSADLHQMQHLSLPGGGTIAAAVIFLGMATAYFSSIGELNRIAQRAVACFAPPLAALLFLLFTDWLNTKAWNFQSTLACLIIFAATVIYFLIYQWLYRRRGGFIFSRLESGTGVSLRKRRRRLLGLWAFLPWVFLALYFVSVQYFVAPAPSADTWFGCPLSAALVPVPGQWTAFPVAMCCAIAVGLLIGHVLGRFSTSKWRRWTIMLLVAVLAAAVEGLSYFGSVNAAVSVYRFIGPLGTVGLQLLFLISTFALLAGLSQRSGFPALTLILLALVVSVMFPNYVGWVALTLGMVCLVFAGMALLSGRFAVAAMMLLVPVLGVVNWHEFRVAPVVGQNALGNGFDALSVKYQFTCWLAQRGIVVPASGSAQQDSSCVRSGQPPAFPPKDGVPTKKYPVFIIAAEGGGIYAASAASVFLARLQDVSPHFDEHVFAISGVSGGAIGAAVFQALDHAARSGSPPTTSASAKQSGGPGAQSPAEAHQQAGSSLAQRAADIMRDDHFSPVVGAIFPEIFGAPLSRSDMLVASFEYSASAQDVHAGEELRAPFAQHWSAGAAPPALVLNATWVETGFRVAFAPFHLHDLDESLYSFADPSMPDEHDKTLMEAAAVSARFPLIMPPFSVQMNGNKWWNFVDGAYSDNSGATTALDLYTALKAVAPPNIDLRIILITSSIPQPDLTGNAINGTVFRDTIAPIDALMKVRENLGNEAVARACGIYQENDQNNPIALPQTKKGNARGMEVNETCIDHAGGFDSPLQIVEIQDQTYGLSLGWKISQTSLAVVSWMLGEPATCPGQDKQSTIVSGPPQPDGEASDENANAQLTKNILQRNSCILKTIRDLIGDAPHQ